MAPQGSRVGSPVPLTSSFDYELPESLIAQRPAQAREAARLMVLSREGAEHRGIVDLPDLLPRNALVVLNQTRVRRARLLGRRPNTHGKAEFLLLEAKQPPDVWFALGRANRPLVVGDRVLVGSLQVDVLEKHDDGRLVVKVHSTEELGAALAKDGVLPLPPYIRRPADAADDERYQTVFARDLGSVAAPTASLHLSRELLSELEARGVEFGFLTLHVGVGTFRPVTTERLEDHVMHSEQVSISSELAEQIQRAKAQRRPVVAVGTTVVRALESAAAETGDVQPMSGPTRLFISPGYRFRVVDALLTNFHMPKSTLLALVAAFAGYDRMMSAYRLAVIERYRFLSYGDAMWIPECYGGSD